MPEERSGNVGVRRVLSARYGASLDPEQALNVKLRTGTPSLQGCKLWANLYATSTSDTPIGAFDVRQVPDANPPRFILGLSADKVKELADHPDVAKGLGSSEGRRQRRLYFTWIFEDGEGRRRPVRYGELIIAMGSSGG